VIQNSPSKSMTGVTSVGKLNKRALREAYQGD
jgi:hypothetical protein